MTTAVIVAGGSGVRMGKDIPKQFIEVLGKPILIYTLEGFEAHPLIDQIEVVCIEGWQERLWDYARQYGIHKLKWVIPGGETVQESIRSGVFHLNGKVNKEDIVIIHDGIRPLVDASVLTDVIEKAGRYGNAVSSLPYNEQVFLADDEISTTRYIPRETLRRVMTPQAYTFSLLEQKYRQAFDQGVGIHGSHYTNTMMAELGVRLYFAAGSDKNIKLTTADDLAWFRAYLQSIPRQSREGGPHESV